jgi:hypothetical protein
VENNRSVILRVYILFHSGHTISELQHLAIWVALLLREEVDITLIGLGMT